MEQKAVIAAFLACMVLPTVQSTMTCDPSTGNYVIEPEADVFLNVILSQRDIGTGGYGCGDVLVETFQAKESLRFALEQLNRDSGQVGNTTITDSYIPGVKLGKY